MLYAFYAADSVFSAEIQLSINGLLDTIKIFSAEIQLSINGLLDTIKIISSTEHYISYLWIWCYCQTYKVGL